MERPTIAKLLGEAIVAGEFNSKDKAGKADGMQNIKGTRKRGDDSTVSVPQEMRLGAYWEHNKHGVAKQGKNMETDEQKPINIRVMGIPNITTMNIGPNWTIEEVRFILARDSGLKHDDIDIYFGGEKLVTDLVASNCGILEDSIITAVLHSRV